MVIIYKHPSEWEVDYLYGIRICRGGFIFYHDDK